MDSEKSVFLLRVNEGEIESALKHALKMTGFKAKGTVVIKPNICAPKYVPGAVTSPTLLGILVRLLRNTAETVIVGESDGYNYPCELAFKKTGIKKVVENAGATVLNFSRDALVRVRFKGSSVKSVYLPKTLLSSDALVNVPVMKTHEFTTYSGAIKNLFGLIPDNRRIFLHPHLNEVLYNIFIHLKPDITIMDALTAMQGNGPTKGKPVRMGLILTSRCPLSLDIVAARIMNIDWRRVGHLLYIAEKIGIREENIKTIGCDPDEVTYSFALPEADLPVKLQHKIYEHEFLTKIAFCNSKLIKILQKFINQYRKLLHPARASL